MFSLVKVARRDGEAFLNNTSFACYKGETEVTAGYRYP